MQNNFVFLSKSCYENNCIAIDENKINSILATTDYYKFSLRSRCRKGQGIGRKQKGDVDWGETVACHAGCYKFSHKHITHNQPIQVTYSSMLITWHIFPVSLIFPISDRTPLCFHGPTLLTETTLGVLLLFNKSESLECTKVVVLKLGAILFYSGIHFKPLKLRNIYIYVYCEDLNRHIPQKINEIRLVGTCRNGYP